MWIKSLELKNFQKHSNLKIDFIKGVNVIYGHSDAGKSCVRRAIEWVCQNTKIDGIRKSGTKMTEVKIQLDNDVVIIRQRSASVNRYIIQKDGQDITFDAIGKTIPKEVKDELKIEPINIDGQDIYLNSSPQLSLPFLFDQSPTQRMKLFNKLTGNDVLDKIFVQLNKDILSINRETKRESGHLEEKEKNLSDLEIKKEKMEAVHDRVSKTIENLRQSEQKYSKLLEIVELISVHAVNVVRVEKRLKEIKIPDVIKLHELRKKAEDLDILKCYENDFEKFKASLEKVRGQLKEINVPTLNYEALNTKIERLQALKNIVIDLDNCQEKCYTLTKKVEDVRKHTINCIDQYKELLKSVQVCPTCGGKITEEHLKEMKLG